MKPENVLAYFLALASGEPSAAQTAAAAAWARPYRRGRCHVPGCGYVETASGFVEKRYICPHHFSVATAILVIEDRGTTLAELADFPRDAGCRCCRGKDRG